MLCPNGGQIGAVVDWIGSVGVVVGWKGGKSGGRLLLCRVKGGLAVRVRPLYPLLGFLSLIWSPVFCDRDWNGLASRMFWHQPAMQFLFGSVQQETASGSNGRRCAHVVILVRMGLDERAERKKKRRKTRDDLLAALLLIGLSLGNIAQTKKGPTGGIPKEWRGSASAWQLVLGSHLLEVGCRQGSNSTVSQGGKGMRGTLQQLQPFSDGGLGPPPTIGSRQLLRATMAARGVNLADRLPRCSTYVVSV